MATCKECLHYRVCAGYGLILDPLHGGVICEDYKHKEDVVEVVHGHKVHHERHRGIHYRIRCPVCCGSFPSNQPYTEVVEYCSECGKKLDDTFQNYCPNCGARMDGDKK